MPRQAPFDKGLFRFLAALKKNNNRDWFQANRSRYEAQVKQPILAFIVDFAPRLEKISPCFLADPRPVGGSMFRIFRDTRFGKDKTPYKTNAGVHFRHEAGKDVHAPGFYLHLAPGEVFAGAGIWRPDSATATRIREALAEDPAGWRRIVGGKAFRRHFRLDGESLKRPPRGFAADHPLVEALKRKDFIAASELTEAEVCAPGFTEELARRWRAAWPFVRFLCDALGLPR